VWLACRTDTTAPKHRGISILIVPTDDPGFSWSPISTVGGLTVTSTYYSGIRVSDQDVVGAVDGGWQLITAQLNHERIGLAALGGRTLGLWHQVLDWARANGALEIPWVQSEFARSHASAELEDDGRRRERHIVGR
jgi:alkylation response protein AidB-like acyl-CoA dehydrogenase